MQVKGISVREFVESHGWKCGEPAAKCVCGTTMAWLLDEVALDSSFICRECGRRYVCQEVHLYPFIQPKVLVAFTLTQVDTLWSDDFLPEFG